MRKNKKIFAVILMLTMVACLAGCGNNSTQTTVTNQTEKQGITIKEGEYLYKTLGNENLENIQKNQPVSVAIYIDGGGHGTMANITDADEIKKIVDMFVKVKVGSLTDEFEADLYNSIAFEFSNGEKCTVFLICKNLEVNGEDGYKNYTLENFDELWEYMNSVATEEDGVPSIGEEYHEGDGIVPTYDQETVEYATEAVEMTTEKDTEVKEIPDDSETEESESPEE